MCNECGKYSSTVLRVPLSLQRPETDDPPQRMRMGQHNAPVVRAIPSHPEVRLLFPSESTSHSLLHYINSQCRPSADISTAHTSPLHVATLWFSMFPGYFNRVLLNSVNDMFRSLSPPPSLSPFSKVRPYKVYS
jgi:hypothetical protein